MSESPFEAHIRVMGIMQTRDLKVGSPVNLTRKPEVREGFEGAGVIENIQSDRYLSIKNDVGEILNIPWVDIDDL